MKFLLGKFLLLSSLILMILGITLTIYICICMHNGRKFIQKGEYEKAINSYRKLLNLGYKLGYTKDHPPLYLLIGGCYIELKEYDKAKKNLQKAIELALYNKEKNRYIEEAKFFLKVIEKIEKIEKRKGDKNAFLNSIAKKNNIMK